MDVVIAILLGAIGSLVAAELYANGPRIADALIRFAVSRLPEDEKARFLEEWRADNEDFVGAIGKVGHAIGCYLGASRVASIVQRCRSLTRDKTGNLPKVGIHQDIKTSNIYEYDPTRHSGPD